MADTTKTLRLAIAADTNNAEKAFANLNKELKNTGVSIASFSTAIYKNAEGVDTYAHSISLAATSVKKLEDAQKSLLGSSQQGPITSNALRDAEALAKSKADLASKSSADMVAKAKASVTAQLIAIREGENSIAAVKNASAERQKQIETNLQEKLKSIRARYAAGEFNKGSLDLSIKSITDAYQRQTISLAVETDKRIAKIKEEQAAQEAYSRSLIGRLSSAPRYIPPTSMISGMSEAGRAASASAAAATVRPLAPIPPIPQETRSSYDSLFARIGAINLEYRIWNTLINTVSESLRGIPKVGIELDSVRASLESTMGSTAGMNSALKALDAEAQRTGINVGTLRDNFKGFQASTSLAGVSLDSTWKMFTNLNTVITGLHLSADKANHVFLAMSQIFNKSKVQSEELVKQLGNLLPGAFASFAASMKIAPEELAKQMKAGTVYAQDTMENFIQYMATKFAPAFAASIDNLNANIGRMQTSFTHLQEAIYEKSAPAMNAFVKSVTSGLDSITNFIKGTEELSGWLKGALYASIGIASASLITLAANLMEAVTAAKALQLAMAFFNPEIAVIAAVAGGVSYLTSEFYKADKAAANLRNTYADINKLGKAMRGIDDTAGKSPAEVLKIKVNQDKNVITAAENLAKAEKDLAEIKPSTTGRGGISQLTSEQQKQLDFGKQVVERAKSELELAKNLAVLQLDKNDKLEKQAATEAKIGKYKGFQEEMEYQSEKYAKTSQEAVDRALKKFEESSAKIKQDAERDIARYKTLQAKPGDSSKEDLENARKVSEEATKALAGYEERKARTIEDAKAKFEAKGNTAAKSAATERLRGIKEEIGQVKEYQRTAANDAENQIKLLDEQNKAKTYSFEEYARRKKEILTKDYEAEKAWYEQQKALAASSGKKGLVTQAEEQLKRLKADYEAKVGTKTTAGIIDTETAKNLQDYETNINMIHEKYRDILGLERDSNDLTSVKLELIRKQLELEATEKGEQGEKAKRILEELRVLKEAQNLRANFEVHAKNLSSAEKLTSDILQRNNELRQTGNMTELQYLISNTKAKEKLVKLSEQEVKAMKEALDTASPEARPAAQAKYDLAVQRLENLKLVADETGAFIENALGTAFESSFEGLITKSMTASQAFANFGKSVMQTIAKIVAEEMKSQLLNSILKPLAGAAMGGLGGLFSSSTAAAASSGFTASNLSSMSSSITPSFAASAKGNVFTSPGLSAHSGTIVSSPTVFPFAKGIGLMGEAGPEAILPLKRNSQGKLGVSVENAGQNKGNLYNITVNVQSKQGENPEQFGQRAATAMMRSIAKEEISNARRPGNTLNKARFG